MVDFNSIIYTLQTWGVLDFLLPFFLVFTIVFAVTKSIHLFKDNKSFQVVIATVVALLFVIPHYTGTYPLGYDPVEVINQSLPSVALVAIFVVMLLLVLGLMGAGFSDKIAPFINILIIGFIIYIFGSSLNLWNSPTDTFGWWSSELTEILLILGVFGLVVWFITKEDKQLDAAAKTKKEEEWKKSGMNPANWFKPNH